MRVGIVLVNWNGARDTIECLDSIRKLSPYGGGIDICIVDNASKSSDLQEITSHLEASKEIDKVVEFEERWTERIARVTVYEHHSNNDVERLKIWLCRSTQNLGFAGGNNLGIEVLKRHFNHRYYWLLNNDTVVDRSCLFELYTYMERGANSNVGICGATLLYYEHPDTVQAMSGVKYNYWLARGKSIGHGLPHTQLLGEEAVRRQLTYVSGAAMFVRPEFLRRIGSMSEEYFLYFEEADWAWRARGLFRFGYCSKALVWHKEGSSIGTATLARPPSLLSDFFQARNALQFARRYRPYMLPVNWLALLFRAIGRLRRAGGAANCIVIVSVLLGRVSPDEEWFVRQGGGQ